jgi:hypothetical protein
VHIDLKFKDQFAEFSREFQNESAVRIFSEYRVYWGSFNQIRATFFLLRKALQEFSFNYVSLISGQDLPVKKIEEMKKFLKEHEGKDFLMVKELEDKTWVEAGGSDRMRLFWITDFSPALKFFYSRLNVIIHKFQHLFKFYRKARLKLYGGENWFTVSRQTAEFVNEFLQKDPSFLNSFKNTRCADEIILPTIVMNTHLRESLVNNSLRFIDWHNGPEYPRTFRESDFERIKNIENDFIARKFDETVDEKIMNRIYMDILND